MNRGSYGNRDWYRQRVDPGYDEMHLGSRGVCLAIACSVRDEASIALQEGAYAYLQKGGFRNVTPFPAPGAFEVAQLTSWLADTGKFAGIVACACIVRGETRHDRHLGAAITAQLLEIGVRTGVAIGNAVLTVNTKEQAKQRSGGKKGNRGEDAARALSALLSTRLLVTGLPPLPRHPGMAAVDLGPDPLNGR